MFEKIAEIQQLAALVNKGNLQEKVLEHILKRCCRVISHSEKISDEEYLKFKTALGSDDTEIQMITSSIDSILQECIYNVAKPNLVLEVSKDPLLLFIIYLNSIALSPVQNWRNLLLLFQGLKNVGMKEEFATVIAQVWSTSARIMVDNVRKQKALTAKMPPQNQLKIIDYSITVRLGNI